MKRSEGRVDADRGPYLAVAVGHSAIDVFNSMGPVLLAFLRTPLALSNAEVGLAVGAYQFLAGATQPPFGWLADRIGSRFMGPLSVSEGTRQELVAHATENHEARRTAEGLQELLQLIVAVREYQLA